MPRNGLGQFVLPPLYNPVQGGTIITTAWGNTTLDDIAAALSTSIATDGQTAPTANLPMGGYRHTNVGPALALNQYARADQVQGWALNIVSGVAADATGTIYGGTIPFNVGNGTVPIPTLMPVLFVPSVNNAGPSQLFLNQGPTYPILNQNLSQLSVGQIRAGRPYALVFLAGNWILVTNTLELTVLNSLYLQLAGGTMTGPLLLYGNPANPTEAATKQYVDNAVTGSVAGVSAFNTRTGAVTLLSGDVTAALTYTPLNVAGGTITGALQVNGVFIAPRSVTTPMVFIQPTNIASTGAVTLDCSLGSSFMAAMTGNMVLTASNAQSGQVIRITLFNTTGRTVTWPGTIWWSGPTYAPPVIDAGVQKSVIVSLEFSGAIWWGNYSIH